MDSSVSALIRRINLQSRRKLNSLFLGEYHSAFKGFGLSFDSVREYTYGDDVRAIDWNVSARMNHLYIKEYTEERELSIIIALDVSGSVDFGTGRVRKEVMLEITAFLLYLAQMNNDRIRVLLFSDTIEKYIAPVKGRKFILRVLDEIVQCTPESRSTDVGVAVDFISRVAKKRSIVFFISDFLQADRSFQQKIKRLSRRHDCICMQVSDPGEQKTGHSGLVEYVDEETGETLLLDSVPESMAFPFIEGIDTVQISTTEPIDRPILEFFERRNRTHILNHRGKLS